eukprot:2068167-Amphidinium_carterae.1
MEDGMLERWMESLNTYGTFIDGGVWTQAYRRRWWLCYWALEADDHMTVETHGQIRKCSASPMWPPRELWMRAGADLNVTSVAMPTLTRGIRRQRRPQTG